MQSDYILDMQHISKSFPGVVALDDVDLRIRPGEIQALMGENGAGKSTLIKILTGVYKANSGTILFDGREVDVTSAQMALELGISPVYQELNMIPYLSVGENIFLGRYPQRPSGRIDWKKLYADAADILMGLELSIDVHAHLENFGTATQQMVSIARAVSRDSKLVVLDEPTSSLDSNEVHLLFKILRRLRDRGIAVIFITHRLQEVFEITENITILKDGKKVGTYPTSSLNQHSLVTKMVGREVSEERRRVRAAASSGNVLVEMKNVSCRPKVADVSLAIREGEIVGLAGLLGSGRTETAELLFGIRHPEAGEILVNGRPTTVSSPGKAIWSRFAFCTENRRIEGIIPNMTVRDNIALSSMKQFSNGIFVAPKRRDRTVTEYVEKLRIKTPSIEQKIKFLSGGNQQKAILARWLATKPHLIILDEPTRGIDVGAKQEVEKLINEFAAQGISVFLISSELAELVRNCDRIYVMREGRMVGELEGDAIGEDIIMKIIAEGKSTSQAIAHHMAAEGMVGR